MQNDKAKAGHNYTEWVYGNAEIEYSYSSALLRQRKRISGPAPAWT